MGRGKNYSDRLKRGTDTTLRLQFEEYIQLGVACSVSRKKAVRMWTFSTIASPETTHMVRRDRVTGAGAARTLQGP